MADKGTTRYYSDLQEKSVANLIEGIRSINSGAGRFGKGDIFKKEASMLIECKCVMSPKNSVSVKKEWIDKNKEEAFSQRLSNGVIAINFEPGGENYFVINEKLFKFLVESLEESYKI